jgi:chemotaxis protein methyltransferase CheR
MKYFKQTGDQWQISQQIRSMVDYRPLNLIKEFGHLGTFDIVYCRNVLIYFDKPTKTEVLHRLANAMAPDGALLLGAAETVIGLTDALVPDPVNRGLYAKASVTEAGTPVRMAVAR